MPSKTIHCAPISFFFAVSMASMPVRSKSPALTTVGDRWASRKKSFFAERPARPQSKRGGIGDDLARAFLEGDENAGCSLRGAPH